MRRHEARGAPSATRPTRDLRPCRREPAGSNDRDVTVTQRDVQVGSPIRRKNLAAFAGLNALAAGVGAVGLATGLIALGDEIESRLPLASPVVAGLGLAMVVALPLSALTLLAWVGHPAVAPAEVVAGSMLVGWITIEVAFIREFSWLQLVYGAIGLGFAVHGALPTGR